MSNTIDAYRLVNACRDEASDAGIRIISELEPLAGKGAPIKPPIYEGGRYQLDQRWQSPSDSSPTPVVVIDQVPSQANRMEAAARAYRRIAGLPELVLDLTAFPLPAHLPRQISSWQFPHRNADAYLRDAQLDGGDFIKTAIGRSIIDATPSNSGALVSWFPQALLFGFWQSHLGKKRANTKHARAMVSEIIGWSPATSSTKVLGLKGDPLNLNTDVQMTFNPLDLERNDWELGKTKGGETKKLSEIGHGQVPYMQESTAALAAVSFARILQTSTISFAQLRRVSLGSDFDAEADATARALVVALGLFAYIHAFGSAFELRSVADLRPTSTSSEWIGSSIGDDAACALPSRDDALALLAQTKERALAQGVPMMGWDSQPLVLTPKENLRAAVIATWGTGDADDQS